MREEIREPQHWRGSNERVVRRNESWSSQLNPQNRVDLAAEVVDAALEESMGENPMKPDTADIISSLSTQLALLEKQRDTLQRLLEQAQG